MTPREFIVAIGPAAQESAHITGIPASFTIAQAALESGWGESQLAKQAFNLFGVKADGSWSGPVLYMPTREFLKGQWVTVTAGWRKYPGWLASINDRAKFFALNPRYRLAMTGRRTGEDFARQIAIAGYATDPRYADKIIAVIRSHKLDQYDEVA
jgi:flagellar rod assembly protein/muramidase FlgJ